MRTRIAIACQGGGSHTAFTAGVLDRLCGDVLDTHEVVGLSGTSGGAVCALLAWYALRDGDPAAAGRLLAEFWADNAASSPWEQLLNASAMLAGDLQQFAVMPAISPYDNVLAGSAAEAFKAMLRRRVDFDRVGPGPQEPVLVIGAVDVLSGEFRAFDSRRDKISAETVLASAAIPTLFRAVSVDGGTFWDGLFSQNPPIRELVDLRPDEIWVIQINPTRRDVEPRTVLDIGDRRNELAGNLSLYQELHFVEKIDEWLEAGVLAGDSGYKSIVVRIVELSPSRVRWSLSARSKLNRDPAFIRDLIAHGRSQADEFMTALAFERAWKEQNSEALLSFFADNVELRSTDPFPEAGPTRGAGDVHTFIDEHLSNAIIDLTRKQVARDRVIWTVKTCAKSSGAPTRGRAEIALTAGRITSLTLGPSSPDS
ncbi:MAG: patatin-like phospholipase family protein [Solirubrobacterales bacterium]|nr:patatin-like phospholipase family protein [Solirubrobacterales bacterium]MBV9364267.1 patatin-like phospholipase family protein [Solirubrobacterales bacterium]MBV9681030.1 patatin-like phospholipase family protein [Solirubrobacterales bacterium]MBV9810465.1 patatin-like phospholipase family protein [Solirubrobacterales bacterium]